jgi:hypothetical protein
VLAFAGAAVAARRAARNAAIVAEAVDGHRLMSGAPTLQGRRSARPVAGGYREGVGGDATPD